MATYILPFAWYKTLGTAEDQNIDFGFSADANLGWTGNPRHNVLFKLDYSALNGVDTSAIIGANLRMFITRFSQAGQCAAGLYPCTRPGTDSAATGRTYNGVNAWNNVGGDYDDSGPRSSVDAMVLGWNSFDVWSLDILGYRAMGINKFIFVASNAETYTAKSEDISRINEPYIELYTAGGSGANAIYFY